VTCVTHPPRPASQGARCGSIHRAQARPFVEGDEVFGEPEGRSYSSDDLELIVVARGLLVVLVLAGMLALANGLLEGS